MSSEGDILSDAILYGPVYAILTLRAPITKQTHITIYHDVFGRVCNLHIYSNIGNISGKI